jgi:hypothetical protein
VQLKAFIITCRVSVNISWSTTDENGSVWSKSNQRQKKKEKSTVRISVSVVLETCNREKERNCQFFLHRRGWEGGALLEFEILALYITYLLSRSFELLLEKRKPRFIFLICLNDQKKSKYLCLIYKQLKSFCNFFQTD